MAVGIADAGDDDARFDFVVAGIHALVDCLDPAARDRDPDVFGPAVGE